MAISRDEVLIRTECFVLANLQAQDPEAAWRATRRLEQLDHGHRPAEPTAAPIAVALDGLALYGRLTAIRFRLLSAEVPDWDLALQVTHWMELIAEERRRTHEETDVTG